MFLLLTGLVADASLAIVPVRFSTTKLLLSAVLINAVQPFSLTCDKLMLQELADMQHLAVANICRHVQHALRV
jgi:hypothetical protein